MDKRNLDQLALLRAVHHQLREPLDSLYHLPDLIQADKHSTLSAESLADLAVIRVEAQQLDLLIALLLDILSATLMLAERQPVDLAKLLQEAVSSASALTPGRPRPELRLQTSLPDVQASDALLLRTVTGLIQYMMQISDPGRLTVWGDVAEGEVVISISESSRGSTRADPPVELSGEQLNSPQSVNLLLGMITAGLYGGRLWASQSSGHGIALHFSCPRRGEEPASR